MAEFVTVSAERRPKRLTSLRVSTHTLESLSGQRDRLSAHFGFALTTEQVLEYALSLLYRTPLPAQAVPPAVQQTVTPNEPVMTADALRRIAEMMRKGEKVPAIKFVREQTNAGLKEAKDFVEKHWQHLMPPRY